jgi:uncharacterized protein involved in exopolysaccharide biosynthesis
MGINYLELFKKHKKFIFIVLFVSVVTSALIVSFLPPFYRASAKIHLTGYNEVRAAYPLLKSRDALDRIIDRFGFFSELDDREEAREKLKRHIQTVFDSRFNVIEIYVTWSEPTKAAQIANALVEELANLIPTQWRIQLTDYKKRLEKDRAELKKLEAQGSFSGIAEHIRKIVKETVKIRANIAIDTELLTALQSNSLDQRADLELFNDIRADKNKLKNLEDELAAYIDKTDSRRYLYLDQLVDIEFNIALYERLIDKLKSQEAMALPPLKIIEAAVPPQKPDGPARTQIVLFTALFSLISAGFLSLSIESFKVYRAKSFSAGLREAQ